MFLSPCCKGSWVKPDLSESQVFFLFFNYYYFIISAVLNLPIPNIVLSTTMPFVTSFGLSLLCASMGRLFLCDSVSFLYLCLRRIFRIR